MKTTITFLIIISLTTGYMRAQTTGTTPEDGSGNTYSWVKIGDQYWMSENLRTTKFANADDILTGYINAEWVTLMVDSTNTGTPAYAAYPSAVTEDGLLYNWFAATDARGICPEGWKVPSDEDWIELEVFAGMLEATARTEGWRHTNYEGQELKSTTRSFAGTDVHGFNALPSGQREKDNGNFISYDTDGCFWTSQQATGHETAHLQGWRRLFRKTYRNINRSPIKKTAGMSIRCMKSALTTSTIAITPLASISSETIYNLSGMKVNSPVESLPQGLYIKRITYTNGETLTIKFTKKL